MTLYAIGQQTIAPAPNFAYPGDFYGLPGLPGTSTAGTGVIAASDIAVGGFAWVVNGLTNQYTNTQVTQAQGSNTIPVFVPRTNSNVYSNLDINQGWSFTVPQNYQLEVFANGSFYSFITISYNAGSVINQGDAIFINTTTGTLAVGVTDQSGFYQSNYVVVNNNVPNTFGLSMVVISNVQAL